MSSGQAYAIPHPGRGLQSPTESVSANVNGGGRESQPGAVSLMVVGMQMSRQVHVFEQLVSSWWHCLEMRFRRWHCWRL